MLSSLPAGALMAKSVSLISKKILPIAMTFILACVVAILGIVTFAEPVFAVDASNTFGKERPPSVDNKIFTFAQFTGALLVLATLQVIVGFVPPFTVTGVLPVVIVKGPDVLSTVTTILSLLVLPPPAWLSLTVKRKFNVLATDGSTSHSLRFVPSSTLCKAGKYLCEATVGSNERNTGPVVEVSSGYL